MKTYSIIILTLISFLFSACSDEFGLPDGRGIQSDGTVELTFSVPTATVVNTRADDVDPEYKLNDVTVLIFNGNDDTTPLAQKIEITSGNNLSYLETTENNEALYKVSFKLDSNIRTSKDLQFYFIANFPNDVSLEGVTISNVRELTTGSKLTMGSIGEPGKLVMSGYSSLPNLTTTKNIPLYRNGTKITVNNAVSSGSSEQIFEPGTTAYPFSVFGTATTSHILAGYLSNSNSNAYCGSPVTTYNFSNDVEDNQYIYTHSTLNTDDNKGKTFIIVKAEYEYKSYFYRLDFKQKKPKQDSPTEEEEEVYLDLLPNHWYQVMIKSINGPGYTTPEEASKHPLSLITYDIHDHAPIIYNMISDGIRELGVTHEVTYKNGVTDAGLWSDESIYIKCFSKYDNEINSLPEGLSISTEEDWLEISNDYDDITDSQSGIDGTPEDHNDKGKILRYKLRFKKTSELGTLNGDITVTWKGLTHKIPVVWQRDFSAKDLCTVTLRMYDSQNDDEKPVVTIDDYWGFLASKEEGSSYSEPGLWGISPDKNNGKVRNRGLHFPVMYGDPGESYNNKRWRYEYDVTINGELKDQTFDWLISIKGDATIENNVKVKVNDSEVSQTEYVKHNAGENLTFKIIRVGNVDYNDYTYGIGKFILNVKPSSESNRTETRLSNEYSFDLYHTGFFHKDKLENFQYEEDNKVVNCIEPLASIDTYNYYYYEVVPIQESSNTRYWLDRNLGAKSAGMYIEATGGTTYDGDPDAAGNYYKVAKYHKNAYIDPEMIATIAPPGYRVPQQKVWDTMRNSERFHTEVNGNHFESYYQTDNIEVGKIYFPKAMMMEENSKLGESRAGYYWTQTASTGTEKEEIGRWLKVLMISGSSTSYINGNVETYKASVRCINDIPDNNTPKRTSFNVNGATHVYLYKLDTDNQTKIPTTTWPGHVIGNYSTMENGWFNFAFESNDFDPSELYVIFNFVDEKGIIHTMSKETILQTKNPTEITSSEANGWKIKGLVSIEIQDPSQKDISGTTNTGYWWVCNHDRPQSVYCYSKQPTIKRQCRIYWKNSLTTNNNICQFIRINENKTSKYTNEENGYFYYDFEIDVLEKISFFFCVYEQSESNNNNETYKSDGFMPWQCGIYDFKKIDNIYCLTVDDYQTTHKGKP